MGAIVGGLYASGMSPDEMQKRLDAVSWPTLLSDSAPRRDIGLRRKEEEAAFPLALEIGFRDGEFRAFKGALSGSNLELFLHELTRNVDTIDDFDKLPIPFRAVATNMVDGEQVVFDGGRLYQAMRASMSVPGMFAPVEIDGQSAGRRRAREQPAGGRRARDGRGHRDRRQHRHAADVARPAVVGGGLRVADGQHPDRAERARAARALRAGRHPDFAGPGRSDVHRLCRSAAGSSSWGSRPPRRSARNSRRSPNPRRAMRRYENRLIVAPGPLPAPGFRDRRRHHATPIRRCSRSQMETQPDEPFSMPDARRATWSGCTDAANSNRSITELVTVGSQTGRHRQRDGKIVGTQFPALRPVAQFRSSGRDAVQPACSGHKRVWINSLGAEWINEVVLGSTRRLSTEFYQPLSVGNLLVRVRLRIGAAQARIHLRRRNAGGGVRRV